MNTPVPTVEVHFRSESRYAERPTAFRWGGRRIAVLRVVAQGRTPSHLFFDVVGDDGGLYRLAYHPLSQTWDITPHTISPGGKTDDHRHPQRNQRQ